MYTTEQIEERVRSLGPWFHNMSLRGVQTAPEHFLGDYPALKWQKVSARDSERPYRKDRSLISAAMAASIRWR